jgi:hypothetical protein
MAGAFSLSSGSGPPVSPIQDDGSAVLREGPEGARVSAYPRPRRAQLSAYLLMHIRSLAVHAVEAQRQEHVSPRFDRSGRDGFIGEQRQEAAYAIE